MSTDANLFRLLMITMICVIQNVFPTTKKSLLPLVRNSSYTSRTGKKGAQALSVSIERVLSVCFIKCLIVIS